MRNAPAAGRQCEERLAQLEASLAELREKHRIISEFSHDWEDWRDEDGAFLYVSPSCEQITGYRHEEFLRNAALLASIVHPDDRHLVNEHLAAAQAQAERSEIEFRIVRRDGQVRWISHVCRPVVDSTSRARGRRSSNRDISDRKHYETALEKARSELEQRVSERTAELSDLIIRLESEVSERLKAQAQLRDSNAALEQRTAQLRGLAAELTQAEQQERRRLAKVLHDHLQQLLVGAKFSADVVRGRARGKAAQDAVHHLSEALDEAIKAARSLTVELSPPVLYEAGLEAGLQWLSRQMRDKHGLAVDVAAEKGAEPAAEELRVFIFEAVREMLFNVVKHADVGRARVEMSACDGQEVQVTVADEGAGFDPAGIEQGAGFGLMSIRERLGLLGGRLEVESMPGRGSRLTLVAPLQPLPPLITGRELARAAVGAGVPAAGVLFSTGQRTRVLLADDHTVMRQGLAALLLEEPDLEVVGQASDGRMAVDLARQLRPDVIIMDVSMPQMGGVEATRMIHREMPEIRVIGLSLHDEADMGPAMRQAGAEAYLNKGGPADLLLTAVRNTRRVN